jgi:magnesium chelatase subunit I
MDGALTGFRPASRGPEAQTSRRAVSRRQEGAQAPSRARSAYPFSAIVGQEEMKRALMIAAVDPSIGGVLIFGDRGTGKSTAIRSLAALLPEMPVVAGCPYACDPTAPAGSCAHCAGLAKGKKPERRMVPVPVVDLPLGTTEDRLAGALDIERALAEGVKAFEPGLLAAAHRGFLYIDEVNLLEDHLVDLLLDVAASGENVVEREGISLRHPARFVLIGSGNPEEGELRPQLLDRFGLSVEVTTPKDLANRVEVVCRRDAFDRDPQGFLKHWSKDEAQIRDMILAGRKRLASVTLPLGTIEKAAELCMALGTDGLRGELTLVRAARALAALEGDLEVGAAHLRRMAPSALRHRLRRNPLDETVATTRVEKALEDVFGA